MTTKTIFAVSDVHGYCREMIRSLDKAGFDENDDNHLLVFCGDMFDRGTQNKKVFEYLESVRNKVLIRGNHEDMLLKIFERGYLADNNYFNGTAETIREFFGECSIDPRDGAINFSDQPEVKPRLKKAILGMRDYFETEKYVFTHGWLPVAEGKIMENWREASAEDWEAAHWIHWPEAYGEGLVLEDKTIVCGHVTARFADKYDVTRPLGITDIFYGKGMIAIDGETYNSGIVNVLVVEDEVDM